MKGSLNLWLLAITFVCGVSLWLGGDLVRSRDTELESTTRPEVGPEDLTAFDPVHLQVLNGTAEDGLAREFALLLGRAGCVAEKVGNAPHTDFARSFLVNRQLPEARAAQLAAALGGIPILHEFDGRSAADAALVLGRDADHLREHLRAR